MSDFFTNGARVLIAATGDFDEAYGVVDHDSGGEVVHIHIDGEPNRYPHDAKPIPRELVTLVETDEDDDEEDEDEGNDMPERRMDEILATELHTDVSFLVGRLETWQGQNPNIADYRVTESLSNLRRASTLLGYLRDNVDPEGDAARAQLQASGFFDSK